MMFISEANAQGGDSSHRTAQNFPEDKLTCQSSRVYCDKIGPVDLFYDDIVQRIGEDNAQFLFKMPSCGLAAERMFNAWRDFGIGASTVDAAEQYGYELVKIGMKSIADQCGFAPLHCERIVEPILEPCLRNDCSLCRSAMDVFNMPSDDSSSIGKVCGAEIEETLQIAQNKIAQCNLDACLANPRDFPVVINRADLNIRGPMMASRILTMSAPRGNPTGESIQPDGNIGAAVRFLESSLRSFNELTVLNETRSAVERIIPEISCFFNDAQDQGVIPVFATVCKVTANDQSRIRLDSVSYETNWENNRAFFDNPESAANILNNRPPTISEARPSARPIDPNRRSACNGVETPQQWLFFVER